MISMNVFRQDAFSGVTLTRQVNKDPYVPTLLGDMDIFEDMPIATTAVQIDMRQNVLSLIPTTPRGAPLPQLIDTKRQARYFDCPRLAKEDTLFASSIQNVRDENGDGLDLKTVETEVARRLLHLKRDMNLTWENHRLGAVQGVVLDADGATVIRNWYAEFGIAMPNDIGFDLLNTLNKPAGYFITSCNNVVRAMKRAGQGAFVENVTEVHALCGDAFYDAIVQHPEVVRTYANWTAAVALREGHTFDAFYFGGIYWHNYRGTDDNSTVAIPTNYARFFPVKAYETFDVAWAPGEGMDDVNRLGEPLKVIVDIDPSSEKAWVNLKMKSYPLFICKRPEMLLRGHLGV